MIEVTSINGAHFVLNSGLIETIHEIPETKIVLTNEKYYLVKETLEEILDRIINYNRSVFAATLATNRKKPI